MEHAAGAACPRLVREVRYLSGAPGSRRRDRLTLFTTSATLLFCELLLIRWTQDRLIYTGFFPNFVLVGSFLGIGLGILLGSRVRWRPTLSALPLFALVAFVHVADPGLFEITAETSFFGTLPGQLRTAVIVGGVVVLATVVMASLAIPLGPLLRALPPLEAYAVDIGGSLFGIALAVALAFLWLPPLVSFGVLVGLLVALMLLERERAPTPLVAASLAAVLALSGLEQVTGETWSPYNRIGIFPSQVSAVNVGGQIRPYGDVLDVLAVGGVINEPLWPASFLDQTFYDEVYRQFPGRRFRHELVIGAAGGDDAAVGLRAGVERIDAVEIDPAIVAVAGARQPGHPFADPRVRTFVNDGRAFLRQSDERYDLIVLARTGSRATIAARAGLRLESFLWTEEAYRSVRDHLAPDGVFVIYYIRTADWAERVAGALTLAFGEPPLLRRYDQDLGGEGYVALSGPGVVGLRADPASHGLRTLEVPPSTAYPTDDWPFLFVSGRSLAPQFVLAICLFAAFALLGLGAVVRGTAGTRASFSPHFFLLGAAFMLLETRSLVVFSLLFGTSWLVNALVFFAILCSVLAAIVVNARLRLPAPALYAGLFLAIGANYMISPETLLVDPPWVRYLGASALAFAPIFFANLVFTFSFRDARRADLAFASNLLGAVAGGLGEWIAVITGYRWLLIALAGLYALAYITATRLRFGLDRATGVRVDDREADGVGSVTRTA